MRYSRPLLYIGIFVLFFLWSYYNLDPDFGWHLRSGQYFIEHGIPSHDIYTYTAADFHWVNHEWLSDSILALLASFNGYWFVSAIYAGMWTLAISIAGKKVHSALVVVAAIGILPFAGVRAITWSVLGLTLLMLLLRQRNRRWRLAIPLLFLAWANLHGSFLIGIAYGGWYVLREKNWKLALIGVASLGLTFVTPYGVELYREVFMTMLDTNLHQRVSEWARFAFPLGSVAYMLIWIGVIAQNGLRWKAYLRFDVLLFVMAVSGVRMVPLFILVSLMPLWKDIKKLDERIRASGATKTLQRKVGMISSWGIVGVAVLLTILSAVIQYTKPSLGGYPSRSVAYLTDHPCSGQLFNNYNYGGYLIWKLPSHKVYIDGRMPSWRQDDRVWMEEYLQVINDEVYRREQFERYHITCVLVDRSWGMVEELKDEGWQVAVEEDSAILLLSPKEN